MSRKIRINPAQLPLHYRQQITIQQPNKPKKINVWEPYRNQWEWKYANEILEFQKKAGENQGYIYEKIKLVLAKGVTYIPDFVVLTTGGRAEIHEVKGFWEQGAWIKFKMAHDQLNHLFDFFVCYIDKFTKQWRIESFETYRKHS